MTDPMAWEQGSKWRRFVLDANDGIVATAGLVEGLVGAGASTGSTRLAAAASLIAGSLALGGARLSEVAVERDAQEEVIEEERRRLALAPEEELAELAELYREKGLPAELAEQVAIELTAHDALESQVSTEFGISMDGVSNPWRAAGVAALGFGVGAAVVLAIVWFMPRTTVGLSTAVAVILALCATSFVAARLGGVPVGRTVLRTVTIGVIAMLVTFAAGSLFVS